MDQLDSTEDQDSDNNLVIANLPFELLCHIFEYIPIRCYPQVALVCSKFYQCTNVDWLWQKYCRKKYDIEQLDDWVGITTYKQLYCTVLHRYGPLLGLWFRFLIYYGGLVCIKIDKGSIVANEYITRRTSEISSNDDVDFDLHFRRIFTISTCDDGSVKFDTYLCPFASYPGRVNVLQESTNNYNRLINEFQLKSVGLDSATEQLNASNLLANRPIIMRWLHEENPYFDSEDFIVKDLLKRKLEIFLIYSPMTAYQRITNLSSRRIADNIPCRYGIYCGSYGAHGIEVLKIMLENDEFVGQKISGDPNVPSGKVSIRANLHQPVTSELQESEDVKVIDNITYYPFKLPERYAHRSSGIPKYCCGQFKGQGHIAFDEFRDSKFIEGRLIIFNESTFGFMWMAQLQSFILFRPLNHNDLHAGFSKLSWSN